MPQRVRQVERVAGATIQIDEPFARFEAVGHSYSQLVEQPSDGFLLAGVDYGNAREIQNLQGFFVLSGLQQRLDYFLHRPEIFLVGFENAQRKSGCLIPVGAFDMQIEEEFGLFAALLEIRHLLEELRCLGKIALGRINTRFNNDRGNIIRLELYGLVRELFTLRLVPTSEGPLGSRNVSLDGVPGLAHGLIQIG